MFSAVLAEKRKFTLKELKDPSLSKDEVRVAVYACGICGSDLPRYFDGAVHGFPIVLGHEFSGTVLEVGSEVSEFNVGDKVVAVPLRPCYECKDCNQGKFSLCKNYKFTGSRVNGGFSDKVVLPKKNLLKIDDSIKLEDALFFETSSVSYHAVELLGGLNNMDVAVLGAGTIGWICAQWARIFGAKTVTMIGRDKSEIYKCDLFGIDNYLITNDDNLESKVKEITEGNGFGRIVDAVAVSETISLAFKLSSSHAIISLVGTPGGDINISSKDWTLINRKEIILKGSWMGYSEPFPGKEWFSTEKFVAQGDLKLGKDLIHKIYPLNKIEDAFESYKSQEKIRGRIIIKN